MDPTTEAINRIIFAKHNNSTTVDLRGLGLTEIPLELLELKNIHTIDLSNNQIESIEPLKKLHTNLSFYLNLTSNNIIDLSPLVSIKGLNALSIAHNQIKDISPLSHIKALTGIDLTQNLIEDFRYLTEMTWLSSLYLGELKIDNIDFLSNLTTLQYLGLYDNQISDMGPISEMLGLRQINLMNNWIEDVTPLQKLPNLTACNLSHNKITNIPKVFIEEVNLNFDFTDHTWVTDGAFHLYGNVIQSPPPEILSAGKASILDYFRKLDEEGKDYLFEAKLLVVGEGGSGKTTFCRKIKDSNALMPKDDESTEGIDILPYNFKSSNGNNIGLNIWDFGGQEIYHQTHQFFLTQRSLYILLTDNRRQDTDFNWWLDTIQAFSDNSPILIVQNERGDRIVDLDMKEINNRYGNQIRRSISVNFATKRGLEDLRLTIEKEASELEHMGEELPKSWVKIRKEIEAIVTGKAYISLEDYLTLCARYEITSREEAQRLSKVYHNLGVFLHFFDNPVLRHTIILRNKWVTKAVYMVLDDKIITDKKGRFNKDDYCRLWNDEDYKEKKEELLALMLKFELCYNMQDTDQYIVPQLLPSEQPTYPWNDQGNTHLRYVYEDYMPKGLVNRLMARLHWYANVDKSWKKGVVLKKRGAIAEIREIFGKKEISIKIQGENQKELLLFIDEELERIHRTYNNLKVDKKIGCNCSSCVNSSERFSYSFKSLETRLKAGKATVECGISYKDINVLKIINQVFQIENRSSVDKNLQLEFNETQKRIFISYSKSDKDSRDRLILYIKQLERNNLVISWSDRELIPGEKWDKKIKAELDRADIILFLLSQDFLSTDYIRDIEMERAFEREKNGDAVILPIIVRKCTWLDENIFPENMALPTKGVPIKDPFWVDEDYALMDVYEGLKITLAALN